MCSSTICTKHYNLLYMSFPAATLRLNHRAPVWVIWNKSARMGKVDIITFKEFIFICTGGNILSYCHLYHVWKTSNIFAKCNKKIKGIGTHIFLSFKNTGIFEHWAYILSLHWPYILCTHVTIEKEWITWFCKLLHLYKSRSFCNEI